MKKYIWAIAAIIMVAGIITIVACSKDNPSTESQNGSTSTQKTSGQVEEQDDEIDIAVWSNDSISFLFDKSNVLSEIQTKFRDSLNIDCVMEDIRIDIIDVEKEEIPVLSVSYFDLDEEKSVTLFGILKQYVNGPSAVTLTLGCREIIAKCTGVNCKETCKAKWEKDPLGWDIFEGCTKCIAKDPLKDYFCKDDPVQRLVSLAIFDSFREGLN